MVAIQESGAQSLDEAINVFRSSAANDENRNNLRTLIQFRNMMI